MVGSLLKLLLLSFLLILFLLLLVIFIFSGYLDRLVGGILLQEIDKVRDFTTTLKGQSEHHTGVT